MAGYEEITTVAENIIIGATESVRTVAEGLAGVGEDFVTKIEQLLNKHRKEIEATAGKVVNDQHAQPGEVEFELRDFDPENFDPDKDELKFSIKAEGKYYGTAEISQDGYSDKTYGAVSKEVNDIAEYMDDLTNDEELKAEAREMASEYKAEALPDEKDLKDSGFSKEEIKEMQEDKGKFDIKLDNMDIKATEAEIKRLDNEHAKAQYELFSLTSKKTEDLPKAEQAQIDKQIKDIEGDIALNRAAYSKELKKLASEKHEKLEHRKANTKASFKAMFNGLKQFGVNTKTAAMQLGRSSIITAKTALNSLQNANDKTKLKVAAVNYSVNKSRAIAHEVKAMNLRDSYLKRNNLKTAFRNLFKKNPDDFNKGLSVKQQAKVNELLAKAAPFNADAEKARAKFNNIHDKMVERNQILNGQRVVNNMDVSKSANKTLEYAKTEAQKIAEMENRANGKKDKTKTEKNNGKDER